MKAVLGVFIRLTFIGALVTAAPTLLAGAAWQDQTADLLRQAQQRTREGKHEEALALYRQVLAASPTSFQANNQAGVVLDFLGRYEEARQHFTKAIESATTPQNRAAAERALAISYAFESNCKGAEQAERGVYERYLAAQDFFNSGEVANELARICLEAGSVDAAAAWYQKGYEAGLKEPGISADRKDLWEFRLEHAQARIAARRANKAEAERHVKAARAVLDRGTNPTQEPFYPYLTGYVAFYTNDYKAAISELQKANLRDPFILSLIAQTYEKLGDSGQALEYYRKVVALPIHNPPGAFSWPLACKKVAQ